MTALSSIKQIELTRYAKAMQAADIYEWRLEIRPGEQVLIVGKQESTPEKSDWD